MPRTRLSGTSVGWSDCCRHCRVPFATEGWLRLQADDQFKRSLLLIDEFCPTYHVMERHEISVRAPVEKVYSVLRSFTMTDSPVVRWLFRLRGLPYDAVTLDAMLKFGFVLLAEIPNQELVFGLAGRFWALKGGIERLDTNTFKQFEKEGCAKAVGNFALCQQTDGITSVVTETRVYCIGNSSRRYFRLYWALIGPFSAWIRREWLRLIKRRAERISEEG